MIIYEIYKFVEFWEKSEMKKIFVFLLILSTLFTCGCTTEDSVTHNPAEYKRTYNIIEESYLEMITDIVSNPTVYIGSKINIEGMFKTEDNRTFVYRKGPECCYPEGIVCGLEFDCKDSSINTNDWILVSGTLSYYQKDNTYYLKLTDCKISKPEKRGLETVQHKEHTEEITIE